MCQLHCTCLSHLSPLESKGHRHGELFTRRRPSPSAWGAPAHAKHQSILFAQIFGNFSLQLSVDLLSCDCKDWVPPGESSGQGVAGQQNPPFLLHKETNLWAKVSAPKIVSCLV